jgi:hypothetical protein
MNNMKGGEKMRKLLILALLVSILIGAMLPTMVLGGNNMIITQKQIAMESGGNNVDQYTNTTVIPEFGPDIWCKWYNTIIRKVSRVLLRVPAGSRDNWIQISGVYCSG